MKSNTLPWSRFGSPSDYPIIAAAVVALAICATATRVYGQGYVVVQMAPANPPDPAARIFEGDGSTALTTANGGYAQIFAGSQGTPEASLVPVSGVLTLTLGRFTAIDVIVSTVGAGATAEIEVRAWKLAPDYSSALANGAPIGSSGIYLYTCQISPPAPPATGGIASFSLVRATPAINWSTPASITYGAALSGTQLNASATGIGGTSLTGTFVYSPAAGTVLNAGNGQSLSVSFSPSDSLTYSSTSKQS